MQTTGSDCKQKSRKSKLTPFKHWIFARRRSYEHHTQANILIRALF